MNRVRIAGAIAAVSGAMLAGITAGSAAPRGEVLAQQWCVQCHGIRTNQASANLDAPNFADIADETSSTAYSLRVFLRTPHPTMPNFVLAADDIDDLVGYILSLRTRK
jgi:mono/diheme cytochrome c family protein